MNISLMCLQIAFCVIFKYRRGKNVKEGNSTICYLMSRNVETLKNRKLTVFCLHKIYLSKQTAVLVAIFFKV